MCAGSVRPIPIHKPGQRHVQEEAGARGLAVSDGLGLAAFCDYDPRRLARCLILPTCSDAATHPNGQRGYLFHNIATARSRTCGNRAGIAGEALSHPRRGGLRKVAGRSVCGHD